MSHREQPSAEVSAAVIRHFGDAVASSSDAVAAVPAGTHLLPIIGISLEMAREQKGSDEGVRSWLAWREDHPSLELAKENGAVLGYADLAFTAAVDAAVERAKAGGLQTTGILRADALHVSALLAQGGDGADMAVPFGNTFPPIESGKAYPMVLFREKLAELAAEIANATPNGPER